MRVIKYREQNLILPLHSKVSGFYKLTAIRPDGRERPLTDWFPNLITNNGMNRPGTVADFLTRCQVGSGTTTPAITDSALTTLVATTTTTVSNVQSGPASAPWYVARTVTYEFAVGVAAGNLAEVGVGWSASGGGLFSHARILDGGGNPTTITVLSDEILQVAFSFRYYAPEADVTGTVGGYGYTLRASLASSLGSGGITTWSLATQGFLGGVRSTSGFPAAQAFSGAIGTVISEPTGTSANDTSRSSIGTYSAGTFYRDFTVGWSLAAANALGGIRSIRAANAVGVVQCEFSPVIPKDSTKVLNVTFRHAWARR